MIQQLIQRKGAACVYRRRVPKDLRDRFKGPHIGEYLGTGWFDQIPN